MKTIEFSTSNNSVTHLGRNLYSTTPPALAELVANSYDAYATVLDINFNEDEDYIVIADNGKGLNFEELEDKYSTIGIEKVKEIPFNGLEERKPMGKKGIGKLAAFSIGDEYEVYTKTKSDNLWLNFKLNYHKMLNDSTYETEVKEVALPNKFKEFSGYESGFIIIISKLRRKISNSTIRNLKMQLSRRFYINQSKTNFNFKIDGEELKLDFKDYYSDIQIVIHFGYEDDKSLKNNFENVYVFEEYNDNQEVLDYLNDNNIYGWIGSAFKPANLKNGNSSLSNIIVFANGKLADEDFLRNFSDARIANQYILGEIYATDFINKLRDPITSSRQGLDNSIREVQELTENIKKIRNYFIKRWDEIRLESASDNLPKRIKENKSYQEWLDKLTVEQKKINNRLLDLLSTKLDIDTDVDDKAVDSMIKSIASVINNMETDELISEIESSDDKNKDLIFKLMDNISKAEDINHGSLIRKRIAAIEELEALIHDSNTTEKIFEKHLTNNPWLINPYWNIDRNKSSSCDYSINSQKYFRSEEEYGKYKRNFLDIFIRVAEEKYPIIVELKKNKIDSYSKVDYPTIYSQINRYRKAIKQNIPELESVNPINIKAVFIISDDSGVDSPENAINLSEDEMILLKQSNIKVLKYSKILKNCKKMYEQHIEYEKDIKLTPDLSEV